jgi:putative glycosyltransferase
VKLSIVSTLYHSALHIAEFVQRAAIAANKHAGDDYEIILVNDGSPDNSLRVALELQLEYPSIRILDLSRNFGHHSAILAGLEEAKGDYVFLIDSDLEEQPEWLHRFFEELHSDNLDVVFGVQERRIASAASNFFGELFWISINFMSSVQIPHNPMTCRLMTRDYVNALLSVEDRVVYLAGVFAWTGFRQKGIGLVKLPRPRGHKSNYSIRRRLFQVTESFSSFSVAPLYAVFLAGVVIWILSVAFGTYQIALKLLRPEFVLSGFTSLIISIWFFSGLMILSIGVVGLYLARIFQEVKRRPLYIVKKIYEGKSNVGAQ